MTKNCFYRSARMGRSYILASSFILALNMLVLTSVKAEYVFYENTTSPVFTNSPVYSVSDLTIWADDIPFSGSHLVSSFSFGYIVHGPVQVTFRFHGVDPNTGKPGETLAEIVREFPQGIVPESTVQLSPAEQFPFMAQPGLNKTSQSGGWFSVQFEPLFEFSRYGSMLLRQARGDSQLGMYSISDGYSRYTFDPDGLLPASLYLRIAAVAGDGVVPPRNDAAPVLEELKLKPAKVSAGAVVLAEVELGSKAPAGGLVVKIKSNKTEHAFPNRSEVMIPAGAKKAEFHVITSDTIERKTTVRISASTENSEVSAKLRIRP